jgi:pyrimidine-nucleoside phosphorylase
LKGYKTNLSVAEFRKTVKDVGCAIVSASAEMAPADQRLYALRDVTATVSSLPLQTASIMSKKIAEGPDSIVLDVKYGDGAFQKTAADAQALAESMVAVGEANGLNPTTAFLTDMNHPIGSAVGNWVEVKECIEVMRGNLKAERLLLSRDLIELVCIQAGQMLLQSRGAADDGSILSSTPETLIGCIEHAYQVLDSGKALIKFRDMALAQGADPVFLEQALETPDLIPLAAYVATWKADLPGYVLDIPAKTIGNIGVMLGAGRTVAGQDVDAQAGITFGKKVGDEVAPGDTLVTVYTNQSQAHADEALECLQKVIQLGMDPPMHAKGALVTHRVTKDGGTELFEMPALFGWCRNDTKE